MAVFDESKDNIVIRIVYVGPPFAGKTESLRKLSQILTGKSDGHGLYSPSDAYGRTLHFDWFDHSAGIFHGRPIRCQIIAVPGQTTLTQRRKMLVDMADSVIFVADSTAARWTKNREFLDEIIPWIKEPQPPIAMVFQLNKQDRPSAYPVDTFQKLLDELNYPNPIVRPSSATTGEGLRETFITAVSLALDRVHAMIAMDALPVSKTLDVSDGQQLFDLMTRREQETFGPPVTSELEEHGHALGSVLPPAANLNDVPAGSGRTEAGTAEKRPMEAASDGADVPVSAVWAIQQHSHAETRAEVATESKPSMESANDRADVPVSAVWDIRQHGHTEVKAESATESKPRMGAVSDSQLVMKSLQTHVMAGGIYPPVHGRERMYAAVAGLRAPELQPDGSWLVCSTEWRLRSGSTETFDGQAPARQHLLELAHAYELLKGLMIRERFVAVTELEGGRYLVWQGVKDELSVGRWLQDGVEQSNSQRCSTMLTVAATRLLRWLSRVSLEPLQSRAAGLTSRIALNLDNMVMREDEFAYSGFLDQPKTISAEAGLLMEQFAQILMPQLRAWPSVRRTEVGDLLRDQLRMTAGLNIEQRAMLETLVALLGGPLDDRGALAA